MDQNSTSPNTQMDRNSTSPNTQNSGGGGTSTVALLWVTGNIIAVIMSLYYLVYYGYELPFLLRVSWSFIIVLSVAYLFARCFYGNSRNPPSSHPIEPRRWANDQAIGLQSTHFNHGSTVTGIEEDTLDLFPKMLYSHQVSQSFKSAQGNELDEAEDKKCCSICLSDYKESDVVRIIPDCGHVFHIDCIEKWLRQQATCPICRASLSPPRGAISHAQESPPTTNFPALDHDSIRPFTV